MKDDSKQWEKELRHKAEDAVRATPEEIKNLSPEEISRMLHEIAVQRTELEMQNEELREAQHELIESRDRYSTLYQQAPVGYIMLDEHGIIREANMTFHRMVNHDDLRGVPFADLLDTEDATIFRARYKVLFRNPGLKQIEARLNRENWAKWVLITPRTQEQTEKKALLLTISDITEKHKAESGMRAFFEQPAGLHIIATRDGIIEHVNKSWEKTLGYTIRELEGRSFLELVHPDDLAATRQQMQILDKGRTVSRFQNRYRHRDGTWRTLTWWSSTLKDDSKVYAIAHDVTDIHEAQERLQLALNGADLGTWDWHIPSGHVVFNERWADMLGYRLDEIEPHFSIWENLVHPDDAPEVRKTLKDHLDGKTDSYESEHRLHHKEGRWIWVLDKGRVIERDETGAPIRACGTHLDITDRKKAEIESKKNRERLEYINLILSTIREVNQLITQQKGSGNFLQPICETIVSGQGLHNAWIALPDPESGDVTETYAAGAGADFTPLVDFLKSEGLPFCARQALTSDTPVIITDPTPQCPDCPCAYEHAGKARIVQRLKCDDRVYGVLSLAAPARFATDREELGLIREMAGDIAFALNKAETKRKLDLTEFALENSSDTVFWIAPDGHFLFVNKAACEQLGYTRDELLSMSVADIDPDFPPERWPQHWENMRAGGAMRFETRHRTKDGHVFPVEVYGSFIEQEGQEYIFAFVHDITERAQNRQKQEEANRRLVETNRDLQKARQASLNIMEDAVLAKEKLELTQFALDHAADAAFRISEDGSFSYVNEAACRSLGYPQEDLLGLNVMDIDPSVNETRWKELWDEVQQKGSVCIETRHQTRDGRLFPVEVHSSTLTFQGKTWHVAFAHDISERKKTQQNLDQSRQRLQSHMQNTPLGVIEWNMNWEIVAWNPAAEKIFGYTSEEIIGRHALTLVPESERDPVVERLNALHEQRGGFHSVNKNITKDNRVLKCDWYNSVLTDEHGHVTGVASLVMDITEQEAQRKALKESEARYRNLFDNMTSGFAVHEMIYDEAGQPADYRFLQVNPAFERLTGLSADDLLGRTVKEVLPATENAWIESFGNVVRTGEPVAFEEFSNELNKFFGVRAFRPEPGQFAVIFSDITERKRLEEALEKRIISLTRPLEDNVRPVFDELFDLPEIQRIQDEFSEATGVASIITAPDGTPLTEPSNFTRLCRDIIRKTEKGCSNCFKSDAVLGRHHPDGPIVQPCLSGGLWDAGVSITVGGHHIANWLIGQVRDETQTDKKMRAYARKIGADENEFIKAFHEVPMMSLDHFKSVAQALFTLAGQLSTSAYQNMQQARFIAEQRKTETDLRRLTTAIEQSPETVIITDTAGTIQYANPAFEYNSGYSREEAIGQNPRILKSGEHDDAFYADMWKTLRSGRIWKGRIKNRRKDGTLYTEESIISPVKDLAGNNTHFVAVKRDITLDLVRDQQLQNSQKMEVVGQLAGGIAHDFNNILQTILGFSELLLSAKDINEKQSRTNVQEIRRAANHAADLTKQLLTFSRKQPAEFSNTDLNETVRGTVPLIKSIMGENIHIQCDCSPQPLAVNADIRQLERSILNMALNARDAMPDGGSFILQTERVSLGAQEAAAQPGARPGTFARLTISDTGTGMSPQVLKHIFEPFFTTKAPGKGTGLGLAAIYGIIQEHNGWINTFSEPGNGSVFSVYLPLDSFTTATNNSENDISDAFPTEDQEHRILVVEDDPAVRNLAENALSKAGYRIECAVSAEEAELIFDRHPGVFDLLISDVILPGRNGAELAASLTKKNPKLRVILCSGYSGDRIRKAGIEKKNFIFLSKPFSIVALLEKVNHVLKQT